MIGVVGGVAAAALFPLQASAQGHGPEGVIWHRAAPFDAVATAVDDAQRAAAGELDLYARTLDLGIDTRHDGLWSIEGADRVWRVGVVSRGARALELLMEDVQVPVGASLGFIDGAGNSLARPMPLELPAGIEACSTPMVFADSLVLEYREPADGPQEGHFRIPGLAHAYRYVDDMLRERTCHVNVACTPESVGWENAITATVRISVVTPQGNGWCSGTLVNNVRQDCAPYILSAFHCGRTSTSSQFAQYKFYFNFQYATCTGGAYSTAQFVTGAQKVAYSDDYDPQYQGLGGSDFLLLRTNVDIPSSFDPYWAGWDATAISTVTADGVCIHHPTGAPKRISSFTQSLTTGHPMTSSGLMTHYKVHWAPTQNGFGVTEVGSSGSGLFKPHAVGPVLIGTLTGSSSGLDCTNNTGTSYFGKMSYHWTNNPNTANLKLKRWLDPDDTGTLVLGGSAHPCTGPAAVTDAGSAASLGVFPNPADDRLFLRAEGPGTFTYQVTDAEGRSIRTGRMAGPNASIDVAGLPHGLYLLRVSDAGRGPVCTPFIVAH